MTDRLDTLTYRSQAVYEPSSMLDHKSPVKLKKLAFLRLAHRRDEFLYPFDEHSIDEAKSLGADIFVFCDRPWMGESIQLPLHDAVDIALLSFNSFDDWFASLARRRRKDIRECSNDGVEIRPMVEPSVSEAQEIVDLYRESPFREGRYFVGYHSWNIRRVMEKFRTNDTWVSNVAIRAGKIVGVTKAKFKGQVAVSNSVLSSLAIRQKVRGVSSSLLAAQIKLLSAKGVKHLKYGHIGLGLDSLDHWKTSNGFRPVKVNYNYVVLTRKARLCSKFGIYQPWEMIFSTKLRFAVPLLGSLQPHLPVRLIQKFHLYA